MYHIISRLNIKVHVLQVFSLMQGGGGNPHSRKSCSGLKIKFYLAKFCGLHSTYRYMKCSLYSQETFIWFGVCIKYKFNAKDTSMLMFLSVVPA